MLAVLYDIHGNLPALEAVLADCDAVGVDGYILGGDYAAFSPWPRETLARLRALPRATWIRGNGERWLREPPPERRLAATESGLDAEEEAWLYSLRPRYELGRVVYVHGSPLSDVECFAAEPQQGEERLLQDVRDRTVVFGHSHLQFRRPGPRRTELISPGSVGMPLDGDRRAAWALQREDGAFELLRTDYDVERAAAAWRRLPGSFAPVVAGRIERGRE